MVAFWPSIRERSAKRPGAARPFPYADAARAPTGDGAAAVTAGAPRWPSLFDWPAEDDGTPAAPPVDASAALRYVAPVWTPIGERRPAAELVGPRMPAYDACYQGLS
eukprot:7388580-Prymnesium_polylepis.1